MRPREIANVLLQSGSGRVGVLFLATLVLASVFVLVRFPLDFGSQRWNDPSQWADNPKAVPPLWLGFLDSEGHVRHVTFRSSEPESVSVVAGVEQRRYTFRYSYDGGRLPTFMSFAASEVRYFDRPPTLSLAVTRPDGTRVTLFQEVVRGPRPGEEAPYLRFQGSPLRVNLSANQGVAAKLGGFLRREYGVNVSSSDLRGRTEEAIFGSPGEGGFEPLRGVYEFQVEAVSGDADDSIRGVKLVLGGSVYGVMGTDALGRDLAMGLLFGFPVALAIGLATSIFATAIGTAMGIVSGFLAGKADLVIQRFADIWSNVPLLPILIFLIFILGQKLWLVVLIMIVFGWPGLTIVVRSMVLQIRTGQLVEATQAMGASKRRIMFRHLLFQIAPFIFAQMIFFTPAAILAEAGLSFLGLGDPSIPTWGQILENGFRTGAVYIGYWWWVLPPGLLIVATAMTFVLLTLGLEPVVNPRLRRS